MIGKPYCVIYAPVDTYSGYGARARDFAKALINLKKDEWQIEIVGCRWGNTPQKFLQEQKEWTWLSEYLSQSNQLTRQPDYMIWITVPNEFQKIGKYNIGVTAGIETTVCDPSWIEGCNRMDKVLVSSQHSKHVFEMSKFEQRDQNTNQIVNLIELRTPVEVLFEGADCDVFKKLEEDQLDNTFDKLDNISEDFCYLFVGHWMQGDLGHDRKNVGLLVRSFYETFKGKPNKPALILKTAGVGSSYLDRHDIMSRISKIRESIKGTDLPTVYLLHGEFSDEQINQLYNHPKVKAMVSLTKGEGFGRPLLEFSLTKKPIITTGWSGHIDFLDPEHTILLGGELEDVHPSALVPNTIIQGSKWFSVNLHEIPNALTVVQKEYDKYLNKAKRQYHKSKHFSLESMELEMGRIIQSIPSFAQQTQLQLPKLKKIQLSELKKESNEA